jgi:hypothetical protein
VDANPDVILEGGTDAAGQERGIRFELERGFEPSQGQRLPIQERQRLRIQACQCFPLKEHRTFIVQFTGQEQAALGREPGVQLALFRLPLVQLALDRRALEPRDQGHRQRAQADLRRSRLSRGQS